MGAHTSARCIALEINRDNELEIASEAREKQKAGDTRKEKRKRKIRVHYGHPKDEGLAANVNDSMDAGGMAAADVTQASEQAKSREFLTKHRFNSCHAVNMERVVQRRAEERAGRLRSRSVSSSRKMTRDPCQAPYLE